MNPRVIILILNWNGWKDTVECLESVYHLMYDNYQIVVVDNGSEDDSVQKIKEYCRDRLSVKSGVNHDSGSNFIPVRELTGEEASRQVEVKEKELVLITAGENYGFAEGNNIGIRFSLKNLEADYFFLLNNDTVVDPNCLKELVTISENDESVGSVQPKILRKNNQDLIDSVGQKMSWDGDIRDEGFGKFDDGTFDFVHEIFGACAAAVLIKRCVLEEVGLFDSDFFSIFEDVDLSWRIRLAGYTSMLVPDAVVYHKRGISGEVSCVTRYYVIRNRMYIVLKYFPFLYILLFLPSYLYYFFQFVKLDSRLGMSSVSTVFKTLGKYLLSRSELMTPYYKETVNKWIVKESIFPWYRKRLKRVLKLR